MKTKYDLFIDSGAFSAWSKGVFISCKEYAKFIKKHLQYITTYANMDCIGDAEGTLRNQHRLEKMGLNPMPVFHYGEPVKFLLGYLKKYDYIGLGGMVPVSNANLVKWLDELFGDYLCGSDGFPKVKIHGFGMTSFNLMKRYPWYSVDSSSWIMTSRMGAILMPALDSEGVVQWHRRPIKVDVSTRSSKIGSLCHFQNFNSKQQKAVLSWLKSHGYEMGFSEIKMKPISFVPDKKTTFKIGMTKDGSKMEVEFRFKKGVCNTYQYRDQINLIFFRELEKHLPSYPWAFKRQSLKGFCI